MVVVAITDFQTAFGIKGTFHNKRWRNVTRSIHLSYSAIVAAETGLEPATSSFTRL
ncbi:Uncharacterised protein [Neisseria zoodegmatis]|uniref:Uncharacterized protein n=1 Tax=Neisseria zoodegmatis TaxID=326523 RepID=A0AB38DTL6_9NEIS|nr:Uncharacterised protein [Neisseria zoodegmatis]